MTIVPPERDGCAPFRSRALTKPTTAKIALKRVRKGALILS